MSLNSIPQISLKNSYFDEFGRCLPFNLKAEVNQKSRRYFLCNRPEIDYHAIHTRVNCYLGKTSISAEEFEVQANALLQRIKDNDECLTLSQGVGVPILLPKAEYLDIGQALSDIYLPAVAKSFQSKFPEYSFVNHVQNSLVNAFQVHSESRHQELLAAMRQRDVVAYFFPCLSEYTVPAALERMNSLPSFFHLAGGFDTALALIACPDLLIRKDAYSPLLWLAALKGVRADAGYYFEAYGYNLTFNYRPHFNKVSECWSSSLIIF